MGRGGLGGVGMRAALGQRKWHMLLSGAGGPEGTQERGSPMGFKCVCLRLVPQSAPLLAALWTSSQPGGGWEGGWNWQAMLPPGKGRSSLKLPLDRSRQGDPEEPFVGKKAWPSRLPFFSPPSFLLEKMWPLPRRRATQCLPCRAHLLNVWLTGV